MSKKPAEFSIIRILDKSSINYNEHDARYRYLVYADPVRWGTRPSRAVYMTHAMAVSFIVNACKNTNFEYKVVKLSAAQDVAELRKI